MAGLAGQATHIRYPSPAMSRRMYVLPRRHLLVTVLNGRPQLEVAPCGLSRSRNVVLMQRIAADLLADIYAAWSCPNAAEDWRQWGARSCKRDPPKNVGERNKRTNVGFTAFIKPSPQKPSPSRSVSRVHCP